MNEIIKITAIGMLVGVVAFFACMAISTNNGTIKIVNPMGTPVIEHITILDEKEKCDKAGGKFYIYASGNPYAEEYRYSISCYIHHEDTKVFFYGIK